MNTLVKPLITEKTMNLVSRGWFTFAVALHARKEEIAREVEAVYKVHVIGVRTISMHGKMRRAGRTQKKVQNQDWKKAIVALKQGETIDAFTVGGGEQQK